MRKVRLVHLPEVANALEKRRQAIIDQWQDLVGVLPDVDKLTLDSAAPLVCGSNGKYPVPMPGIVRDREYKV